MNACSRPAKLSGRRRRPLARPSPSAPAAATTTPPLVEAPSSSSSSSAEFARPEPVASLPAIPAGGSTAVALDQGFVDALGTLGLTPGTVGDATLADGSVSFPITGGTVTVFDKEHRLQALRPGHDLPPGQRPEPDRRWHHGRADQLHHRPGHPVAPLR